jgi:hypothetical protein
MARFANFHQFNWDPRFKVLIDQGNLNEIFNTKSWSVSQIIQFNNPI